MTSSNANTEPFNTGEHITYRIIGRVENDFDEPVAAEKIRSAESRIILDPTLAGGLQGLESNQQVIVLFHFHRSHGFEPCQHPKGDKRRPKRGVFALRSPRRPNPIGLSVVNLVGIKGNILRMRGLDAINGTPVLDIKPA